MADIEVRRVRFEDIEQHSELGRDGVWYPEYLGDTHIVLVSGDLVITGDLDLNDVQRSLNLPSEVTEKTLGVWVTGALEASGSILKPDQGDGPSAWYLVVEGHTKAKNIIAGGAEILLWGGASVDNAIIAPDSTSVFNIQGELSAKWIISESDNFGFSRDAQAEVVVQTTYALGSWGFADEDYEDIFLPQYLTTLDASDEPELKMDTVVGAVQTGLNLFKDELPKTSKRIRA